MSNSNSKLYQYEPILKQEITIINNENTKCEISMNTLVTYQVYCYNLEFVIMVIICTKTLVPKPCSDVIKLYIRLSFPIHTPLLIEITLALKSTNCVPFNF